MLREQLGDEGKIRKAVPKDINGHLIWHVGNPMRRLDVPVSTPAPSIGSIICVYALWISLTALLCQSFVIYDTSDHSNALRGIEIGGIKLDDCLNKVYQNTVAC